MEKWRNIIFVTVGCLTLIGGLVEIVKIIEQNNSRDKLLKQHIQWIDSHLKRLDVSIEKIKDNKC